MAVPPHILEEIRNRLSLVQLVGRDLALKQRGRGDWWGLSPFTSEKTPSFHVREDQHFFHCFSTGEHGDHFSWLMKRHGLSFGEALQQLADEAGVALPKLDPQTQEQIAQRQSHYEINEFAAQWFQRQFLKSSEALHARSYAQERGLKDEALHHFRIGYAPDNRDDFIKEAKAKGIGLLDLEEAGLIKLAEDGQSPPYPLFRNRLMFPIIDGKDRVIAFGGRYLGDAKAARVGKYINSPETPLFSKSYVLFHYHQSVQNWRQSQKVKPSALKSSLPAQLGLSHLPLLVVEGYMDVIALWQVGIAAVAPLGTALTESQLELLWRVDHHPCLCFDGDEAGKNAANRGAMRGLARLQSGRSLSFVFLPEGEDPDSLVTKAGAAPINSLLSKRLSLEQVLFQAALAGHDFAAPEQRALVEKTLDEWCLTIEEGRMRRHFHQALKSLFWDEVRKGRTLALPRPSGQRANRGRGDSPYTTAQGPSLGAKLRARAAKLDQQWQKLLLAIMLAYPSLIEAYWEPLNGIRFDSDLDKLRIDLQIGFASILAAREGSYSATPTDEDWTEVADQLLTRLADTGHTEALAELESQNVRSLAPSVWQSGSVTEAEVTLKGLFDGFQLRQLRGEISRQASYRPTADHQDIWMNRILALQQDYQNHEALQKQWRDEMMRQQDH